MLMKNFVNMIVGLVWGDILFINFEEIIFYFILDLVFVLRENGSFCEC